MDAWYFPANSISKEDKKKEDTVVSDSELIPSTIALMAHTASILSTHP